MSFMRMDPSFYPSPKLAMAAPPEELAYVACLLSGSGRPDFMAVVDVKPGSPTYGQIVSRLELGVGEELHHFGWNACSAALCPLGHPGLERRYLVVPGLRSSHIHIIDTKAEPRGLKLVKTIDAEQVLKHTGYSRLHTVHCGLDAIYLSALGDPEGDAPGGLFMLDHFSFTPLGRWEVDRGPQRLAYDFAWHIAHDVAVTSEWAPPKLFENGLNVEALVNRQYGHCLHFWDMRRRTHVATVDLGDQHQMALELRPAHDPTQQYGFVGVVADVTNLASSIFLWFREGDTWQARKVIEIPAVAADPATLPPALQPFKAVPPLVTDINLSLDDRFLYVSCWGTGELRQYDVSDPHNPKLTGTVQAGGILHRAQHPNGRPLAGAPQMVEVSRDGRRIYFTNSLYSSWDDQFYPEGVPGWMIKLNANPAGGIEIDPDFFVDFGAARSHQVRLSGGDSSSDTYCFA